jgi:DNA phosphorothioation-associated putative methyltransferase
MQSDIEQLSTIALMCQRSAVGKLLPNAFYVHLSALSYLEPEIQSYENLARLAAPPVKEATLVKISTTQAKVSYLFYPDFDTEPHPALQASIQVDLQSFQVSSRDYSASDNSPILHPKETFVAPDYPLYEQFAQLTRTEVALGFLEHPRSIGTRREWLQRLENHGVEFRGHHLIKRDVGGEGEQGSRGAEERGRKKQRIRGAGEQRRKQVNLFPPHLGTSAPGHLHNLQPATSN